MGNIINPRVRGLIGAPRNDAANAKEILEALGRTVEQFKAENDARLKEMDRKFADVVQAEKVDRINADITKLTNELAAINAAIAAIDAGNAGGGAGDDVDPAVRKARVEYGKSFNRWFRKGGEQIESSLHGLAVQAAMQTGSDVDGGYLVTPEQSNTIDQLLRTVSSMRDLATVMSIGTNQYKKLVNAQGTTGGWVGETGSRTETNTSTLMELIFTVMELYANPAATQGTLDDANLDIGAWLGNEVALEFADMEGAAFVTGNGVARPRGFTSYTNVANASYAWGKVGYIASGAAGAFASSNPADAIISLQHALRSAYRANAQWLANDSTIEAIRKLKDGDGNYLWRAGLELGKPDTLLGKPIRTDDNMADIGANSYSLAFADWARAYLIIDRVGIRVLRDPFTNKPYVHFYTTKRVGGGIQNFEAIKLMKFAAS